MNVPAPHFLLFSEAAAKAEVGHCVAKASAAKAAASRNSGESDAISQWRFVLRSPDGRTHLEAADDEPHASAERLELLAIVRGLESLDEPSQVTLVSPSRSISRGLRHGIVQWRENDWQWERYGQMTPIKNRDLWRRIDRAMSIHRVECRDNGLCDADDLAPPSSAPSIAVVPSRRSRGKTLRFDRGSGDATRRSPGTASSHSNSRSWLSRLRQWAGKCLEATFA